MSPMWVLFNSHRFSAQGNIIYNHFFIQNGPSQLVKVGEIFSNKEKKTFRIVDETLISQMGFFSVFTAF